MTNHLREWLQYQMYKNKLNQQDLANRIIVDSGGEERHPTRQYISQVLKGNTGGMPDVWVALLDSFDHTLLVIPNSKAAEVAKAVSPIIGDDVPSVVLKEMAMQK